MLWGAKHRTLNKSFLQDGWFCLVHERVDCRIRKPCWIGYFHPTLLLRLREPNAWKERCNEALDKTYFRLEAWVWKHKRNQTRSLRVILQPSIWHGDNNSLKEIHCDWRMHHIFRSYLPFRFILFLRMFHSCSTHTHWNSKSGHLYLLHCSAGKNE